MKTHSAVDKGTLAPALAALGTVVDVETVAKTEPVFSTEERLEIIDRSITILTQLYVHLPMKTRRYAIAPVADLRILREQAADLAGHMFQRRLITIFNSLRDVHIAYTPPPPYTTMTAFLPFIVERCGADTPADATYVVTHLLAGFHHPTFKPGVTITMWNGVPIRRAVEILGEQEAANNVHARAALALQFLTVRWLGSNPLPDERWLTICYADAQGDEHEIRLAWNVLQFDKDPGFLFGAQAVWLLEDEAHKDHLDLAGQPQVTPAHLTKGLSQRSHVEAAARRTLFVPEAEDPVAAPILVGLKEDSLGGEKGADLAETHAELTSNLPHIFQAAHLNSAKDGKTYGYIRIRSFEHADMFGFVIEFRRLLALMPRTGLIIDIRANPGGVIQCAEGCLQFLTPKPITPLHFQFLGSEINERMTHPSALDGREIPPHAAELARNWGRSLDMSIRTGAVYSAGAPLTPVDHANLFGQEYYGPSALIIDATSFSSADMFAAGFQDHDIGPIIGTDESTGGAGANCWTYDQALEFLPGDAQFAPLPKGAKIRYSARRCMRIGHSTGLPLEELGVRADIVHNPTRRDVLGDNTDLKQIAMDALADRQAGTLEVTITKSRLVVGGSGIDRVDIFINDRPVTSRAVDGGKPVSVPHPGDLAGLFLEIRAYNQDTLAAGYKRFLK